MDGETLTRLKWLRGILLKHGEEATGLSVFEKKAGREDV